MPNQATPFDLAAHQRRRIRALERDLAGLAHVRDELLRLLALTARVAAGQDCDPYLLLFLTDAYDRERRETREAIDADIVAGERFLTLLRAPATEDAA